MIFNGIDVPDEYANDAGMREAYLKSQQAQGGDPPKVEDPPKVDPPKVEDPPKVDPLTPTPTATEIKWEEFGEEFKSKDDLANAIKEYRSLKQTPPSVIDDPVFYRLAVLKKESPEEYKIFKKIVLDEETDSIELLTIDYVRQNPAFKGSEDKVKNFLKRQYQLTNDMPEEPDAEDQSPEANRIRADIRNKKEEREFFETKMRGDAERVKQSLINERFEKIELPTIAKPEDVAQSREQRKQTYEKLAPEAVKGLDALPILIKNEKGEMVKIMDFKLTDAHKTRLQQLMIELGSSTSGEINTDHATNVIANAISILKEETQAEINTVLITSARAMAEADYYKLYHNPAPIGGGGEPTGGGTGAKSKFQESREAAFDMEMKGLRQ